ncbi:hypothetical protein [Chroococcidiopsis sp. CCMEE 29]|uniref:hypothetical protein n=1 Tax=Chroococcidiopsis sp. CCMEE 29 TaxID=155894 RepID=UPI0020210085|nr:hypothetical protein [Chroococcidiopsis sp. CCMEE 29]
MNDASQQLLARTSRSSYQLGELIEETFSLVKKYMPEVEIKAAWDYYKLWSDKY